MKNIYVANLSYQISSEDLKQAFEEYGEVISAKVITDKYSGKSRGFGFVEMQNDEEADKAIEELNNAEFDSKVISVSIAKPKPKTDSRGGGGGFNRNSGGGGGYGGGGGQRSGGDRGGYNKNRY
jgi:RNA recognition motif-containing protein